MQKTDLILLKYGEIALKGLNRPKFEQKLIDNINSTLAPLGKFSVKKAQSTIYVEALDENIDMTETIERLKKVFGIVNICPATRCAKGMDSIPASKGKIGRKGPINRPSNKLSAP